ncbi:hypothetical protein [uncultured Porphyromonas sp.]|nr:hypothetical protein [uncultured Porphyromonas sp.]
METNAVSYLWHSSFLPMALQFPTHGTAVSYPWYYSFLPMAL